MGNPERLSMAFAEVLRRQRKRRHLTQEALADAAGLHSTYVSMVERLASKPTLEVAARLADALDVPLSRLVAAAERTARRPRG